MLRTADLRKHGLLNTADTVTVLQALGLLPSQSGGRYGPSDGRRIAGQKRAAIDRSEQDQACGSQKPAATCRNGSEQTPHQESA